MNVENAPYEISYTQFLRSKKKPQSGPSLQVRDLALLYFTWQSRYVAQRQYRQKFWPTSSQAAVSKRLNELKEAHLIKTHALPWLRDRILYSITIVGTKVLRNEGFEIVAVGDCPKAANDFTPGMKHDLDLVDLRTACEASGYIIEWHGEHQMRLHRKQGKGPVRIVDGMFNFQAPGREAWGLFEYERMGYRRLKFHDILHRLYFAYRPDLDMYVFFVCATPQRAEVLRRWAADSIWKVDRERIVFSHYEAVKAAGLAGGFLDLNGMPLKLPKLLDELAS